MASKFGEAIIQDVSVLAHFRLPQDGHESLEKPF